jgi:hypothetical protein
MKRILLGLGLGLVLAVPAHAQLLWQNTQGSGPVKTDGNGHIAVINNPTTEQQTSSRIFDNAAVNSASPVPCFSVSFQPIWNINPINLTIDCMTCGMKYTCVSTCDGVQLVYTMSQQNASSFLEQNFNNTCDMRASIKTSDGTIHQLYVNGASVWLGSPGQTITTDRMGIHIVAGDYITVYSFVNRVADNGQTYSDGTAGLLTSTQTYLPNNSKPNGASSAWNNGDGFTFSNSTTTPPTYDTTSTGTVSASTVGFGFMPTVVLGWANKETSKSVIIVGDSIAWQTGDYPLAPYINTGSQYIHYALTPAFGIEQLAVGSDNAYLWINSWSTLFRGTQLANAKYAIIEMGRNDMNHAGETTLATVQATEIALWNMVSAYGEKCFVTTVTPYTTSTDYWVTTANQTYQSAAAESIRQQYNTWIRARAPMLNGVAVAVGTGGAITMGAGGHPLSGYFDPAMNVETSLNSGYWKSGIVAVSSTSTAGSTTTLTDSTQSWTTNQYSGYMLDDITKSTSSIIVTNTATVVTTATSIGAASSDVYKIVNSETYDGLHPSPTAIMGDMASSINPALLVP